MFEYNGIKIRWYGHDTFTLEKSVTICIDPYKLSRSIHPDIILISHNHFDHMSLDDLKKISNNDTIIVAAKECMQQLDKINPDTHKPFHPKEDNKVGFVISIGETSIYHTGDSDLIPEMSDLKPDVLLVPVSGTYVMTAKEAAKAVEKIKPKVTIPMHYGTLVGSDADAKEFKDTVKSCEVQVLTKE